MDDLVRFHVDVPIAPRKRLSVFFRPILIIPHALLVGGPFIGFMGLGFCRAGGLGAVAWLVAVFDWFAILFGNGPLPGLQFLKHIYLAWRARLLAYAGFLCDAYPPFGEGEYPAAIELQPEPTERKKDAVLLRPILVIPHFLLLMILFFAWFFVALFVWIWLPLTGTMPASLWRFTRNVMAYSLKVEAYALLIHDEFPSFSIFVESERKESL